MPGRLPAPNHLLDAIFASTNKLTIQDRQVILRFLAGDDTCPPCQPLQPPPHAFQFLEEAASNALRNAADSNDSNNREMMDVDVDILASNNGGGTSSVASLSAAPSTLLVNDSSAAGNLLNEFASRVRTGDVSGYSISSTTQSGFSNRQQQDPPTTNRVRQRQLGGLVTASQVEGSRQQARSNGSDSNNNNPIRQILLHEDRRTELRQINGSVANTQSTNNQSGPSAVNQDGEVDDIPTMQMSTGSGSVSRPNDSTTMKTYTIVDQIIFEMDYSTGCWKKLRRRIRMADKTQKSTTNDPHSTLNPPPTINIHRNISTSRAASSANNDGNVRSIPISSRNSTETRDIPVIRRRSALVPGQFEPLATPVTTNNTGNFNDHPSHVLHTRNPISANDSGAARVRGTTLGLPQYLSSIRGVSRDEPSMNVPELIPNNSAIHFSGR